MKHAAKSWSFSFDGSPGGIHLSGNGRVALCDEVGAIRQSIMLILATVPGERLMRPEYGCELNRILFLPNDYSTAGLAKYYIEKAINRWERRVILRDIDVQADSGHPERINIHLQYEIKNLHVSDAIGFSLDIAGGTGTAGGAVNAY